MPNPLGFVAGVATAAVKGMMELYERKYGKWGEAKVKALQKELLGLASEVDALHVENEKLTADLKAAKVREKILLLDIENLKKQVQILDYLRVEKATIEENPF